MKEKRTWVYAQPPLVYGLACHAVNGLACDIEPQWSEYQDYLWCPKCKVDFIPEDAGVFSGPIMVETCEMLGIFFHQINLETEQFEIFMPDSLDGSGCHKLIPVNLKPSELAVLKRFFVATSK